LQPSDEDKAEELFGAAELATMQVELIHDFVEGPPPIARRFLTRDFVRTYVRALDEVIHPPWHLACFVADPTNASMWSVYGDRHRGICLKFNAMDRNGRLALNLFGLTGYRTGKGSKPEPIRSFAPYPFHKVSYSETYPEINFFKSIGRLPLQPGFWYTAEDGEISNCHPEKAGDIDEWRRQYWAAFHAGLICKASDWAHEQEYRLLLSSTLHDLTEVDSRKLRYHFADLSGIIFGAETTIENKLKIVQIVSEKCRAERRENFEFYQAQYSRQRRGFKIERLTMLPVRR
jgi:Protein of unknown function (DUF2971)